ncbi:MAG: hypothetical protein GF344_07045 [Chitinivibrionales bacterium]|nr:hypothetical protein [Chitinivibrionales bacterium]MBD3356668.1 hypothetical protein [Chitinivibrionales bacterium]
MGESLLVVNKSDFPGRIDFYENGTAVLSFAEKIQCSPLHKIGFFARFMPEGLTAILCSPKRATVKRRHSTTMSIFGFSRSMNMDQDKCRGRTTAI